MAVMSFVTKKQVRLASQMVGQLGCRVQLYITNAALWSFCVFSPFDMCWNTSNKHMNSSYELTIT